MMDLAFNFEEEKTMPAEAAAEGPQPKTVTELSNEIKRFVEGNFGRVLVRGEIFGAKRADSGHWYLSLKDENAVLSAVCWRGVASGLKVKIEDRFGSHRFGKNNHLFGEIFIPAGDREP